MAIRRLRYDDRARAALQLGVDAVADAVAVTLGPRGRSVLVDRTPDQAALDPGGLTVTNDGVTVAREISLADPFANQGAGFLREVTIATNDAVGDGTTTAALLAQAILREGLRHVAAGWNPVALRRGIEHAVDLVVADLGRQSVTLDGDQQVRRVATLAAADDEVGAAVAEAFGEVGSDGVVKVETGNTVGIELELADGMNWDRGYISPYMITHADRGEAVLDEPFILLADRRLDNAYELLPLVEKVKQAGKPLFVVAKYLEGEALAMLLVNKLQGNLTTAACKSPDFARRSRRALDDMAVLTGGSVVSEESGLVLEEMEPSDLGRARQVVVTRSEATIIEGRGDAVEVAGRMAALREEIADNKLSFYDRKLGERLARLAGVIGVVKVGAPTDTEINERKLRAEDAVHATRAALEEGVVPGGGTALVNARAAIDADGLDPGAAIGAEIVRRMLAEPLRRLAANSGFDGGTVVAGVAALGPGEGFDASTGAYCDLIEAGIIDPTKVTRMAIENAASVAKTVLTAEAIVVEA